MEAIQDFSRLYRNVSENMAAAMADVSKLAVSNTEGQGRLDHITETLKEIQAGFNEELEFLETNAEWEKFTMAFFGETNAGKSTIIESLRILFNEESRQQLIDQNLGDVDKLAEQINSHANHAEQALLQAFQKHGDDLAAARHECNQLAKILNDEASERVRIAERQAADSKALAEREAEGRLKIAERQAAESKKLAVREADARLKIAELQAAESKNVAEREAAERLKIAESEADTRSRNKRIVAGVLGALVGAGLTATALIVVGI